MSGARKITHPVLALECVPAKYPAPAAVEPNAAALHWSAPILASARALIGGRRIVAIQWREEFARMGRNDRCNGFSLQQCDGVRDSVEQSALCAPPAADMSAMLERAMAIAGASAFFVASDAPLRDMGAGVGEVFASAAQKWEMLTQEGGTGKNGLYRPQIDLAVLSEAQLMIAHCPSSFSSVATRIRKAAGRPTAFWGILKTIPTEPIPEHGEV
eukprot:SAG11_NODE_2845_length_2913_cov_2.068230_3_plen_215_part_00